MEAHVNSVRLSSVSWGISCAVSSWDAFYSSLHPQSPAQDQEDLGTSFTICSYLTLPLCISLFSSVKWTINSSYPI